MEMINIAVGDDTGKQTGTEQRRARPTPVPGLAITGERGQYVITHVASGRRVCWASIYNTNATLDKIRNAMMAATMIDMACKTVVDWTVDADELAKHACSDWVRAFGGALAHS